MSISQSIAASVTITGRQSVTIRTTEAGQGSHISVVTGIVMVTLHDQRAAWTYCSAWLHPVDLAGLLPKVSRGDVVQPRHSSLLAGQQYQEEAAKTPVAGPSVLIDARGTDQVKHGYDRSANRMLVKIGNVTWTVTDAAAYASMRDAHVKIDKLARIILPEARITPKPLRRR